MNCVIPGANLKIMSKAIQALSRIGDELFLEAKPDRLNFVSMNSAKTAFTSYSFLETFFSTYDVSNPDDDGVTCKIPMKSMMTIFKKSPLHKDKKIEICKMELGNDSTKILFKFKYKNDVTIVHSLNLIDYESVSVSYNKDTARSCVSASGTFLTQVLSNFQISDEDMSFEFTPSKVIVRNYDTNSRNVRRDIRSQITLMAPEFLQFNVPQDINITLSLKSFRSAVSFAEFFDLNVAIFFEIGGRPAIVEIRNPTFEATYVMATVNTDGSTQSTTSTTSTVVQTKTVNPSTSKTPLNNITIQDQEAVDNMDWDDFDSNDDKSKKSSSSSSKSRVSFSAILKREMERMGQQKRDSLRKEKDTCRDNEVVEQNIENLEVIPNSPETPLVKKKKIVFNRCVEKTFHPSMLNLGKQLTTVNDSDSDCET